MLAVRESELSKRLQMSAMLARAVSDSLVMALHAVKSSASPSRD
jgi:hypothetical protein